MALTTTGPSQPPRTPGPPHPLTTPQVGGVPSPLPDIPVSVALLALFLAGAAANMAVFQRNRRRRYKFLFSALLFGFYMARSVRRIVRACYPLFGWRGLVTALFRTSFVSAGVVLVMFITVTVYGFFFGGRAGDGHAKSADRTVQLVCGAYLAVYAFLSVPVVALALAVPRRTRIDKFGEGHFRTKVLLLTAAVAAALLAARALFRAVTAFVRRPVADAAWLHGRACYYCFNFGVELGFHVQDGSSAPGHYSCTDFGPEAVVVAAAASVEELEKMKQAYLCGGRRRGEADWAAGSPSCSRRELYGDDEDEQKQGYV
ncbi:hypothetical protein MMYC01_200160 [Madurella mycetomatis]|uniref:Uncharacterized protein n=1 Tax=Madurella mycetomatis TaxID=100816 RepID=A0A150ASH6_9PEZI|nr:hypothetical protein MMYC01_200160 [Madurella mycetomatis]